MPVSVMRVRQVRVVVDQTPVDVGMSVGLYAGIARAVLVLVMLVVFMQVLVFERFVRVHVAVTLPKQ